MIAIVESPLQLKNVVHVYSQDKSDLIIFIRLNGEEKNDDLLRMFTLPNNAKVKFFLMKKGNKFHILKGFIMSIFFCLLSKRLFDEVYIGDWRSKWMRLAAYIISPFRVNVLDDGFATINIVKELNVKARTIRKKYRKNYHKISKLFPRFYSNFELESEHIEVFYLPRPIGDSSKNLKNKAFFIGSPLCDKGIISQKYALTLYQSVLNNISYLSDSIVYIPHRAESSTWLSLVLNKFPEMEIIEPDCAVEDYLSSLAYSPDIIFSFYSTALYNLQFMNRHTRVISYRIDEEQLLTNKENIRQVYEYLNSYTTVEVRNIESYTYD